MRSSKKNSSRPCYIVLAWSREDGYFLRQKAMWQKQVGHVNPEYTGKHRDKMADHDHRCHWDTDNGCEDNTEETSRLCAAVKGNHKNLETDMCLYFKNLQLCGDWKEQGIKKGGKGTWADRGQEVYTRQWVSDRQSKGKTGKA